MMERQVQAESRDAPELNRDPITGTPGAHPIGTGIGAAGGAAAGAAVGSLTGPIGTAVGGVVGALVGGLAGKGVGEAMSPTGEERAEPTLLELTGTGPSQPLLEPTAEDLYWQRAFITEPYYNSERVYDDYEPAYRVGYLHRKDKPQLTWEETETLLQSEWERTKGTSRLSWDEARDPMRAAWTRADTALAGGDPYFGVT